MLAIAPALMPASEARTMAALSRPTAASSSRIACWSSSSESTTFNKLRGEEGQSRVSLRAGYRRIALCMRDASVYGDSFYGRLSRRRG
jgi:hypothetical protein